MSDVRHKHSESQVIHSFAYHQPSCSSLGSPPPPAVRTVSHAASHLTPFVLPSCHLLSSPLTLAFLTPACHPSPCLFFPLSPLFQFPHHSSTLFALASPPTSGMSTAWAPSSQCSASPCTRPRGTPHWRAGCAGGHSFKLAWISLCAPV